MHTLIVPPLACVCVDTVDLSLVSHGSLKYLCGDARGGALYPH